MVLLAGALSRIAPAHAQTPPPLAEKGDCVTTTIENITARFEECEMGARGAATRFRRPHGTPPEYKDQDCGLIVSYAFGDIQLSYTTNVTVKDDWRAGDVVEVCRTDEPYICSDRSVRDLAHYRAMNGRTGTGWEAVNRSHTGCNPTDAEMLELSGTQDLLKLPAGLKKKEVFDRIVYGPLYLRRADRCSAGFCDPSYERVYPHDLQTLERADTWTFFFFGAADAPHTYRFAFDGDHLKTVTYDPPSTILETDD